MRQAPIPARENKASERQAPKGPPKFSTEAEIELTEDKLGSRAE